MQLLRYWTSSSPAVPACCPILRRELDLFTEWFLARHHGLSLDDGDRQAIDEVFGRIIATNLAEPKVYVHRDFQDAVYGPISYDMVSLLKDACVEWDEDLALDWLIRYYQQALTAKPTTRWRASPVC